MSNLMWQGLMISVMGLGLTFAALGLLILTMNLLERFSPGSTRPPILSKVVPGKKPAADAIAEDTEEAIATAITVAVTYLREIDDARAAAAYQADLGVRLEAGHGRWWTVGRTQQRSINTPRKIRRRN